VRAIGREHKLYPGKLLDARLLGCKEIAGCREIASAWGKTMELSIYQRQQHPAEFVLTPAIMVPCIDAQHRYGPLVYVGVVETDSSADGRNWKDVLHAVERDGYTVVSDGGMGSAADGRNRSSPQLTEATPLR
jgi:hypothetical protein